MSKDLYKDLMETLDQHREKIKEQEYLKLSNNMKHLYLIEELYTIELVVNILTDEKKILAVPLYLECAINPGLWYNRFTKFKEPFHISYYNFQSVVSMNNNILFEIYHQLDQYSELNLNSFLVTNCYLTNEKTKTIEGLTEIDED
jgi:hypothetical protein